MQLFDHMIKRKVLCDYFYNQLSVGLIYLSKDLLVPSSQIFERICYLGFSSYLCMNEISVLVRFKKRTLNVSLLAVGSCDGHF